ncbi:hypothetical protein [Streptomyces sp. NBC_01716]|uniref:hypothetical protein n=1 Tax=Streptomyces sp. NBC_01716 TaxID=2975917 RepID=UPI002E371F9A|nr:hypothetical protein [Streptomyces sp. NBC_01716]
MNKKVLIIVVGACVGLWVVGSVIRPVLKKHDEHFPDAFNDVVLGERIKNYPTADSAPESGDGEGIFVLPAWVPADATDLTIKAETTGNAKLLRFTLGDTALKLGDEKACEAGAFTDGPELEASWFAEDAQDNSGARTDCSEQYQYRITVKDREVYAWSNGDLAEA